MSETSHTFSDSQRRDLLAALSVGCDCETAAHYAGREPGELRQALDNDQQFARDVRQAQARVEITHMRNIYTAAGDVKNWRASVLWLERRAPDRFGPRKGRSSRPRERRTLVDELAKLIARDVKDQRDRQRLLAQLATLT